jgi:hypothetical protein
MMPSERKLGTLVFLLIVTFGISIPALAFENEPDRFRGIKWGTNISELPEINTSALVEDEGGLKSYARKNDKMKIGDADIDQISYNFYKNRFCGILIRFHGHSNFIEVKEDFVRQYGKPNRPNEYMERYRWEGKTVGIILDYKEITEEGQINYFFIPIFQQFTDDHKEKAK